MYAFWKNWAEHSEDLYALDLASNVVQLDLKETPL